MKLKLPRVLHIDQNCRIDKKTLVLALGFLFLFEFPFLQIGIIRKFSYAIESVLVLIWGMKYSQGIIFNLKKPFFLFLFLYEVWTYLVELYTGSISLGLLYSAIAPIVVINVIYIERKRIVNSLYILFAPIVVTQITVLLLLQCYVPNNWSGILGGKNGVARYLVLGFVVLGIKAYESKKRFPLLLSFLVIVECYLSRSSTAMVIAIMAVIIILFIKRAIISELLLIGMACVEFLLVAVFAKYHELLEGITALFGKRSSFTDRTDIWLSAISVYKNNRILGVGRGNLDIPTYSLGSVIHYTEAHNAFLQILLQGGIPALLLYCIFFVIAVKMIDKVNNKAGKTIMLGIIMVFLYGLMESIGDLIPVMMCVGLIYAYAKTSVNLETQRRFRADDNNLYPSLQ